MVTDLVGWAARAGAALYLVTFGLALGESALLTDVVVPGEAGMVLAGAAGREADLSLALLVGCAAIGAVLGDSISYAVGRRWGVDLVNRWSFTRRRVAPQLARAERHFERHGGRSVFLARWVGALRAVVPAVAGASGMAYLRFLGWSALSSVLWTATVVSLGWFMGDAVAGIVDRLGWMTSLVVIGLLVLYLAWRRRRRNHSSTSSDRSLAHPA